MTELPMNKPKQETLAEYIRRKLKVINAPDADAPEGRIEQLDQRLNASDELADVMADYGETIADALEAIELIDWMEKEKLGVSYSDRAGAWVVQGHGQVLGNIGTSCFGILRALRNARNNPQ